MSLIGDAIKRERLRANMTSKQLADTVALSGQYIGDIQHGRRLPSVDTLLVICNVFPDANSAAWLWLLLRDLWGDPVADVMRRSAAPPVAGEGELPAERRRLTGGEGDNGSLD